MPSLQKNFHFMVSNAHFRAFSGPSECLRLTVIVHVQTSSTPAHCHIPGSIKDIAEEGTERVNVIFRSTEYATNLITANVETLSHDDSYSHSSSSDGHTFGEPWPFGPLWIRH